LKALRRLRSCSSRLAVAFFISLVSSRAAMAMVGEALPGFVWREEGAAVSRAVTTRVGERVGTTTKESGFTRFTTVGFMLLDAVGGGDGDTEERAEGVAVGLSEEKSVREAEGDAEGAVSGSVVEADGLEEGDADDAALGLLLGDEDDMTEGKDEGLLEGDDDGLKEGDAEGFSVGRLLGEADGDAEGEVEGVLDGLDDALAEREAEGS